MKCEKCNSSIIFVDAETDKAWCKSCGYVEFVDYKAINRKVPEVVAIDGENWRAWVIDELRTWVDSFDFDPSRGSDDDEDTNKNNFTLPLTIEKFREKEILTPEEYEDMLFHLWQCKSDEWD